MRSASFRSASRKTRIRLASALLLALGATVAAFAPSCEYNVGPPVSISVGGGFGVTIIEQNKLVVKGKDDRVLLDGLPPGDVDQDIPYTGFAVQNQTVTYEMVGGAFKPTVTEDTSWTVAQYFKTHEDNIIDAADKDY